jgi:hypothetical protein
MADNVAITAGTGTDIATDDCGAGGHVQLVKLAISTDGSATPILADAKGLEVQQATAADLNVTEASAAAIATSLAILDDWDESDRAKVNLIVGQAGIAAGTGTDGATVPRVTLATNVGLPAGTSNIGDVDVLTVPEVAAVAASVINSTSSDGGTALTNGAQAIKASAGRLLGYFVFNPNAVTSYVQFYNTASGSVTVGTTNPLFMLAIPAASAANLWMQAGGVSFGTAMSWAATSTAGGNGAPTTALDAVAFYA